MDLPFNAKPAAGIRKAKNGTVGKGEGGSATNDHVDGAVTTPSILAWSRIFLLIGVFLMVFSLTNFIELPLGWKDRVPQFTRYLNATLGLGSAWVMPTLWLVKGVEAALGIIALVGLVRRNPYILMACIAGWMIECTGFTFMDVWAADRAELVEHTTYFVLFAQLLATVFLVGIASRIRPWLQRHNPDPDPGTQEALPVGHPGSSKRSAASGSWFQPRGRNAVSTLEAAIEPTASPQPAEAAAVPGGASRGRRLRRNVLLMTVGVVVALAVTGLTVYALNTQAHKTVPTQASQPVPPVTSNSGPGRSAAPLPSTGPKLTYGDRSEDVKRLQQALAAALDRPLPVTGYFGELTMQAVRDYQRMRGLSVTGAVDEATWAALQGR
jgi:Putative peptidoglycan binding domain